MIKYFEVEGLNGKDKKETYFFNDDLNIITGRNGAGKTTFLKLIWYILSGNVNLAINEIQFKELKLETNNYVIKIYPNEDYEVAKKDLLAERNGDINNNFNRLENKFGKRLLIPTGYDIEIFDVKTNLVLLKTNNDATVQEVETLLSGLMNDSIFFPTFRRIEGGYSTNTKPYGDRELEKALKNVADNLSSQNHRFITSISTVDIVELLTRQYAETSEQVNDVYIEFSKSIEDKILNHSAKKNLPTAELLHDATSVLEEIKMSLDSASNFREVKLQPFEVLNKLIDLIFDQKGIKVNESITLGKSKAAMISDSLSAGEKQMLSFLCYNTFYRNSVIFIDEPEISLHVDWQRILMRTLISQKSGNQFIVATHSPFIYSNYVDKEIVLDTDRGGY